MLHGMVVCPLCETDNPAGSRFCNGCGGPLNAPATLPEERKVVTALFCDLVGFTATSERADPEDIDRMLTTYSAMARHHVEAHGGVVEKFIGDAILGVFGVPATHEDDPERAVRAALRICEDAADLQALGEAPLQLRVGINTGEVLVRVGVAPGTGERFLAGDTVNTASRIQAVAPEMGVAVGLATYEATKAVFEYAELPPATLRGKAEPVRVFRPTASRARLGTDITRTHRGPFIGREVDLALLRGLFDKSVEAEAVGLVTVVAGPGLGKSRLVAELATYADAKPEPITWRQGRCLPYGEGITFWALGEIVKAHAGILESDPASVAADKLEAVLPEGAERPWFRQRLLPLLGIEATSSAAQEELFTAWRRFLEHLAERNPTVLVFEDLHWADAGLIAFLEHVGSRTEGVPLLLIGTARPELFERHPLFPGNRINLAPLSTAETSRLVAGLLGAAVPPELAGPILERAEGNPLYAEEFVRLLRDRDLLDESNGTISLRPGATVPLPDSIGALLAARLDTLPPDRKSLLADAAVVGKVFWAGAVAAMGERDLAAVTDVLRELSRKELVRPARRSSFEGEAEYAFWHVLARDVAYNALPRASRAARHVAAARWIESKAPARVEDLADVLAYHYGTALELARADGQASEAAELADPAFRFLSLAGERALGLDTAAAFANLERALALAPAGHPERPRALLRFGEAAWHAGRYTEAAAALEEAVTLFRARGDLPAAGMAMRQLARVMSDLGDPRAFTLPVEALAILEPLGPSPELVALLAACASAATGQTTNLDAIRYADRALVMAADLGLPEPASAVVVRGVARALGGDAEGIDEVRRAIAIAAAAEDGVAVAEASFLLGYLLCLFEGPSACLAFMREAIALARGRGLVGFIDASLGATLDVLADTGEFDEALRVASDLETRSGASALALLGVHVARAEIAGVRGRGGEQVTSLDWLVGHAREAGARDWLIMGLASAALVYQTLGDPGTAVALLSEIESTPANRWDANYAAYLPTMVRTALAAGDPALANRLVTGFEARHPYGTHALITANAALAEARGDLAGAAEAYLDAAGRWERFGVVPEQAFALLGQGRCLVGLRRPAEALPVLHEARHLFERLGAAPALAETDALLETTD